VQSATEEVFRELPLLTKLAFNRLLEWLDDGVDSDGENYIEMRRRLVSYFDRRNRLSSDELADETLNRIGRTLEKTGSIAVSPPARYCYVVARFVLLEDFRRERRRVRLDVERSDGGSSRRVATLLERDEGLAEREERLECLDCCLQLLKPEQRELIGEYYRDARRQKIEHRRDLAKRLGISMNALGIRACRIRDALEACVEARRREQRALRSFHPNGRTVKSSETFL
jgi:DNA-directed RNA polymerase specialized sigma24 family protein